MILKNLCRPQLITDQLIHHLKIIQTLILTLKRTNRHPVDFTIVVRLLPTVDTPPKLTTRPSCLINFGRWQ